MTDDAREWFLRRGLPPVLTRRVGTIAVPYDVPVVWSQETTWPSARPAATSIAH